MPEEAEIVKLIFEKFTKEDLSADEIAEYLNSHSYKKKKARSREVNYFQRRLILNIIDNPAYIGKIVCGRSTTEKKKGLAGTVSRHTKKDTDQYKDTFYYRCLRRGYLEDGNKCDFKVNQDVFNKEVETAIIIHLQYCK